MILYCDNPNDIVLASYQLSLDNSAITDATVKCTVCEKDPGGQITNATNATPIVITSAAHGLTNGQTIYVNDVEGNRAANGYFTVANVTTNTFELSGSVGNGAYLTGGYWYRPVTGASNLTMAYNSSRREYRATVDQHIPIRSGSNYISFIDTSYGDHWEIGTQAATRT